MTSPVATALCVIALLSAAAPGAAQPRPDPLDAAAPVPELRYRSSLSLYRGLADDEPVAWKDANDTTARIGGWRAYAREARAPASAGSAPTAGADTQ